MNIHQILSSKIVRKLLVILISLTVFPILISGSLLIETGQEATRTAVLRDYQEIATRAAREIDLLVGRSQDMLFAMAATIGVTHTDPWKLETAVVELQLNVQSFQYLLFFDMNGKVLASGNLDYELKDSDFIRTSLLALQQFKADPTKKIYQSPDYFVEKHVPAVTMAAPVRQLGRPVGMLAAQVDFHEMWNLVDGIKIGQTGRAYVVSNSGKVIAHLDKKNVLQEEDWRHLAPVERVLDRHTGSMDYTHPDGEAFLSAYAPLTSIGWGVVVEQPAEEAYATIGIMLRQAWGITVISAIIALVIGILTARSIVRPVLRLVEGTQQISQGDLTHRIDLKRLDEIGQLAVSFNEMAQSLKESYEGLELKVAQRTSQLRRAMEEVERLNELKSKFVSEVAHELRTPLTSIQGYADTLIRLRNRMDEEKKQECLRTISDESTRLTRLINDLLDLSRIESGRIELDRSPVDMAPVAREAIQAAQSRTEDKNIRIDLILPAVLPQVMADRDAIRRVFDNLIGNAMKFTPVRGLVTVTLSSRRTHVHVIIADTGIGIPDHEIEHIFEPFFRVNTSGARTTGTGLGLPIVKSIVEEHGGEVSASSTPGQGSVLTFTLPAMDGKDVSHERE